MTERHTDAEFVEYIVKQLVDNPEDVQVNRRIDEKGVLITLDVNPKDMGMVIGRDGMTAKALRTLLRVIGARSNARVNLKINEPAGSERPERSERSERPERREEDSNAESQENKKTLDEVVGDLNV